MNDFYQKKARFENSKRASLFDKRIKRPDWLPATRAFR